MYTKPAIQKVLYLEDELKKKKPKLQGEWLITEKYEGWYVYLLYDASTGLWTTPYSSRGRKIPSLKFMHERLNLILPKPMTNHMLIAEAYIFDMAFPQLNGLLNRSKGNCDCLDTVLMCHDLIDLSNPNRNALDRFKQTSEIITHKGKQDWLQPAKVISTETFSKDNWERYKNQIIEAGGEGIVAKRLTSGYSFGKRNADLIKLKPRLTFDLLAESVKIGVGEKGNPSYVITCRRKDLTEIKVVVNRHEDQDTLKNNPDKILGKVVTVKAMEEYPNGKLRQPTFAWVRHDDIDKDID